jgi:peroxiredoxin
LRHQTLRNLRLILTAAAAAALIACSSPVSDRAHVRAESERKLAPDFTLKDADGKTVRLSDYRGKVVLLNFWATWCGPCKIEIPWFVEFERAHKSQGFAVIGVSMDDDGWTTVKPFVSDLRINYRILLGDDKVAQLYGGVGALPTSFLIDRSGRIAATYVGLESKSRYENDLEQVVAAPASASNVGSGRVMRAAAARAE